MMEISVEDFAILKKNKEDFQLIDVREPYEYEACNLGGELMPLGDIPRCVDKIDRKKKVILYCKSGSRSFQVSKWLTNKHNFDNLYSLKGGITAWIRQIDPSMGQDYL